jgi:hypothetical protein
MKQLFIIATMVTLAACSNETSTSSSDSTCMDSTCCDSTLVDSISINQVKQLDSLYTKGKL